MLQQLELNKTNNSFVFKLKQIPQSQKISTKDFETTSR